MGRRVEVIQGDHFWMKNANCRTRGYDKDRGRDLFFLSKGQSKAEAVEICNGCPVKKQCGDYADSIGVKYGIFAGKNYGDRNKKNGSKDE